MPILRDNRKSNFVSFLRPNGSKWAQGQYTYETGDRTSMSFWSTLAIDRAFRAFEEEFGHKPKRTSCVIEVTFTNLYAHAKVIELAGRP
jgi:hypothetical protein